MVKEREFLKELNKRRLYKLHFIDSFKNDRYLRSCLFNIYKHNSKTNLLEDLKIFKTLNEVHNEVDDFQRIVLNNDKIDYPEYSNEFVKSVIYKLENLKIPKLTRRILKDFIDDSGNIDIFTSHVLEFNDFTFKKKYGITINVAERKYRELKRFANNYFIDYLKETEIKLNEMIKRFNHVDFLDHKEVIRELKNFNNIGDRLNYLKNIKTNYFDKFDEVSNEIIKNGDYLFYLLNNATIKEKILSKYRTLTPLSIQEPVYNYYFKDGLNNPEYTHWFLKYNSENVFYDYIHSKEFKRQVNSKLKETFLKAKLKELNGFETRAKKLLLNKELDIYESHRNNYNYYYEIVLLRVLDGNYYKENITYTTGSGSIEVLSYFNHILLKPYLEKLIQIIDKEPQLELNHMQTIPNKIKLFFKFINYLHSNIDNFNQYNDLIKELELLKKERYKLSPDKNYKDKLKFDKVKAELESKFKVLQENTATLIKAKAKELDVCNFDNEPIYSFMGIEAEINQLKRNFSSEILPEIFKYKTLYLEYRSQTHKTFLSLSFFFDELDEISKTLFDFFKHNKQNEFEYFETKAIEVNSIQEAVKVFKQGQTKFILPNPILANQDFKGNEETKSPNSKPTKDNINSNLVFKTECITIIYDVLKVHFKDQQKELLDLLQNSTIPKTKLYFTSNANRLADTFKKLIENNFISNCTKAELEKWIFDNFTYRNKGKQTDFSARSLNDIISSKAENKPPCKSPLIEIKNQIIEKV